jgi:DNA-binding IscR family transcriptional regulator
VKEKVINSAKGPTGGFYITSFQKDQPIVNVIMAIDGIEVFDECGLGLSKCSATHPCPMHNDYKDIRDRFKEMCEHKKVSDLCQTVNTGLSYLAG